MYLDFMVINEPNPLDPAWLHRHDELLECINLLFPEVLWMIPSNWCSWRAEVDISLELDSNSHGEAPE